MGAIGPLGQFAFNVALASPEQERPNAFLQFLQIPVSNRPATFIELVIFPVESEQRANDGFRKSTIENNSSIRFSIGVPVKTNAYRLCSRLIARVVFVLQFLMRCASSNTTTSSDADLLRLRRSFASCSLLDIDHRAGCFEEASAHDLLHIVGVKCHLFHGVHTLSTAPQMKPHRKGDEGGALNYLGARN